MFTSEPIDKARADNQVAQSTYMNLYWNHLYNAELYNNIYYTSKTGAARIGYNTPTPFYQQTISTKGKPNR